MDTYAVIANIEAVAPLSIAASWDRSGIQVPCLRTEVRHLAVTLDPTPAALGQALACGADMVLTHHPLTLSPRFTDRDGPYLQALRLLLREDVMLYAAHTSLDANPDGPSSLLPRRLNMTNREILERTGVLPGTDVPAGLGVVGDVEPTSVGPIMAMIDCPYVRLVGADPEALPPVTRLAVCTGAGGSLAAAAKRAGAQLLVTGDLKYHAAVEAPLPILDVGHFSLEEAMIRRFAEMLQETMPALTVTFIPGRDPFITLCNNPRRL